MLPWLFAASREKGVCGDGRMEKRGSGLRSFTVANRSMGVLAPVLLFDN